MALGMYFFSEFSMRTISFISKRLTHSFLGIDMVSYINLGAFRIFLKISSRNIAHCKISKLKALFCRETWGFVAFLCFRF